MRELQLQSLKEGPVISMGKHAAILQATYDGKPAVVKSFRPEDFPREYAQMQATPPRITIEGGYKKPRPYYFEKEERVLCLLAQHFQQRTIGQLAPAYYNCHPSRLQVVMEHVDDPTYRDQFVRVEDDFFELEELLEKEPLEKEERARGERGLQERKEQQKKPYWERMLEQVTRFNLAANSTAVRESFLQLPYQRTPLVDLRTKEEERHRLAHYIRLIVITHSEEFRSSYGVTGDWRYTPHEWRKKKRNIQKFLAEKGIVLNQFIDRTLERHRMILYGGRDPYTNSADRDLLVSEGKLAIVHGDFGPQNVFYTKQSLGKVIDFDELRLDSPQFDIVHALYHVASDPSEPTAYRLLREYFMQECPLGKTPLPELFCEHIAVRLIEGIRKIASDDRMSLSELRKFAGGFKRTKPAGREHLLRYNFERLGEFIDFYRNGEGVDALSESPEKGSLVNEQLADWSRFYRRITSPGSGFLEALGK